MISELLGFDSDYIIIGLTAVVLILLILYIVNIVQMSKIKKNYRIFMEGKDAKSLEDTLIKRIDQVDELLSAFNEMGGKLSFSLALLNEIDDGFVLNAVHSREGCYTYIKEIVAGNSIIALADEEQEALDMAKGTKETTTK